LAAALYVEQTAANLCAWTSDEPQPTELPQGSVDLWLVLCAGDPPAPPPWRETVGGAWAVFPGTAQRWTEATRRTTDAWSPSYVLSDLLPDETESSVWHDWWRERELVWLPAWGGETKKANGGRRLAIVTDPSFSGWLAGSVLPPLAEVVGGSLVSVTGRSGCGAADYVLAANAERLLLCSNDPIHAGILLRLAAENGVACLVWGGVRPGSLRQLLLAGRPATVFTQGQGDDSIAPVLRALVVSLHRLTRATPVAVRPADWRWWAGEEPDLFAGDEVGRAARFVCAELRVSGTWNRAAGAAYGAVGGWFRRQVRELWRVDRPARTEQELGWATEMLGASCDGPDGSSAAVHLLARLRALRGDSAGAEACLARYAELTGGEPAELPAVVALILARRGPAGAGAAILRRWPVRSPLAFAWFLYAMAWLWAEEEEAAIAALRTCRQMQPGFWDDANVRDARWALAAIALQRVGLTAAAAAREAHAAGIAVETTTLQFLDLLHDTVPGASTQQEIWVGLLGAASPS
jgi:hypothetical protein